jgi:hypothetical protein
MVEGALADYNKQLESTGYKQASLLQAVFGADPVRDIEKASKEALDALGKQIDQFLQERSGTSPEKAVKALLGDSKAFAEQMRKQWAGEDAQRTFLDGGSEADRAAAREAVLRKQALQTAQQAPFAFAGATMDAADDAARRAQRRAELESSFPANPDTTRDLNKQLESLNSRRAKLYNATNEEQDGKRRIELAEEYAAVVARITELEQSREKVKRKEMDSSIKAADDANKALKEEEQARKTAAQQAQQAARQQAQMQQQRLEPVAQSWLSAAIRGPQIAGDVLTRGSFGARVAEAANNDTTARDSLQVLRQIRDGISRIGTGGTTPSFAFGS